MASIACAVDRIKDDPARFIPASIITDACQRSGHRWRERVLGPVVTVRLMILQVLFGNLSCRGLTRVAGLGVSGVAYCKARGRLPLDVLGRVMHAIHGEAVRRCDAHAASPSDNGMSHNFRGNFRGSFRGLRNFRGKVALIDGSGVSMPDTPALQRAFGQPGRCLAGCGFPVMHTLWLFDAATGLLLDLVASRWNTHDLADAAKLHPAMNEGDLLIGDRAFCSYAHIAMLLQANLHALVRAHQRLIIDFSPGRRPRHEHAKRRRRGITHSTQLAKLGKRDQLVRWDKPPAHSRPSWMTPAQYDRLPGSITVRELQYDITRPGFRTQSVTLVTTLLDATAASGCPADELAQMYNIRWRIETDLGHLKQTMRMDVLRCKSVDGVMKELWSYAIAYNLVRLLMLDAAHRQKVPPNRLSFIDALDVLRHANAAASHQTARIKVNPDRPGRHEPRRIKRPKDRYTYLTKPRDVLKKTLGIAEDSA